MHAWWHNTVIPSKSARDKLQNFRDLLGYAIDQSVSELVIAAWEMHRAGGEL